VLQEIGVGSVTELMSKYKADASGDGDGIPGFSATSGIYNVHVHVGCRICWNFDFVL
jgi:hypothetical protein